MRLRAGVVGVGYLGNFHAQKIKANPSAELVGVTDFHRPQAEKVAADLGVRAFESPEAMIGQVDYVHIAASTQAHFNLTKLFLENRIPVLVEKPIAATLAQAEELCELSEKKQTLLSVGHIERFNPAFVFLKDRIDGVRFLEINRLAPFRVRGSDVSVLHDLTIHDIDLVHWLFASPVKEFEVCGTKLIRPTIDDVSLRLQLENGVVVTINNSRITPQIVRNYRAVGSKEVIYTNTATLEAEILKSSANDPFHTLEKIQIEKRDALALEADHFVKAVKGEVAPAITAREATLALNLVEKFVSTIEGQKR